MPTTNGNRKILDLKRWEFVTPVPTATAAGMCFNMSNHFRQLGLYLTSVTTAFMYLAEEDAYVELPSPGLGGTFGAGTCIVSVPFSIGSGTGAASLTATAGTTTTITTTLTLARDLRGFSIQIVSGPNAGLTIPIVSNTLGTNSIITVATQANAFSASTVFRLITPTWYVINAGAISATSFRKYDYATNTWTSLTQTGLPATISTDSVLVSTPSWFGTTYSTFATGTASSGGLNTITNSSKTWTTNQWTNYQIRITSGTGAGQIRTVSSNTGTAITVSSNWATQPDNTSVYSIEGNDDFIYYMGSNAVGLIRYSITSNTWTTLSPTAARAAAPNTGMSGHWINGITESDWTNESVIINGRRIYSFRGGAGAVLDYYDIALNTWVSALTYSPSTVTFTTGTKYSYYGNFLYIQKESTGRWFRYDFARSQMDPWNTLTYPQSTAALGNTSFVVLYTDGATVIPYIHFVLNSLTICLRQMVI
jgi:hypothetical protein